MKTNKGAHLITNVLTKQQHSLFASLTDISDIGEQVMVFSLGHGLPELWRILEHADQDLETVEIGVLRRDHLKNGLRRSKRHINREET